MTEALDPNEPVEYLIGHIEEALACDERVNEAGLHVTIQGRRVFVDGTVSTNVRHAAVTEVVGELLPGWTVVNQSTVAGEFPEPTVAEMESLS